MGASKQEFINLRMSTEVYHDLPPYVREQTEIKTIDEEGWQEVYKEDEAWQAQSKISNKAYKELKKIEFGIRHNKKSNEGQHS